MFDMLTAPYAHPLKRLIWMRLKAGARAVWDTISGNPVSFSAKAAPLRQLEVAFSPVQNLNGYDSPWPAGGGVNKANLAGATIYETLPTWASASLDIDAEEITITGTPTGTSSQFRLIRVPNIVNGLNLKAFGSNLVNSLLWDGTNKTIQVVLMGMTEGTPVTIKFKFVAYEGQTAPTAWTPYSNLCPISGWSSLTVEQGGKNLLDWETKVRDNLSPTPSVLRFVPIDLPKNTTLTYSDDYGQWNAKCFLQLTTASNASEWDDAWKVALIDANAANRSKYTFTTPDTDEQLYLRFYANQKYFDYCTWMQIEVGSDNTAYEVYNPSSRSISVTFPAMGKNKLKLTADNIVRKNGGTLFSDEFGQNSYTMKDVAGVYALAVFWGLFMVTEDMVGQKVTFSMTKTGGEGRWALAADGNDWSTNTPLDLGMSATITIESSYVGHALGFRYYNPTGATQTISNVQVEFSASATAFEPYTNVAYSGTVDVVTGQGGDSGSKISFAPNHISTWFNEDAARDTLGFYLQANDFKARYPAPLNANAMFEEYKKQSAYTNYTPWIANVLFVSGNFNRFEARVPKSVLAPFSTYAESVAAVLAYLAEHPIVMWYEKAEPTPISLTPQEVESLAGDNTMWTDAASLEVTYRSN